MAAPATKPVSDAPSTSTRILDVAEELFAERGFAGASVREIAGRVGLNQASIYNHFPSKQALYEAVLERGLKPIGELLATGAERLLTGEDGDELIEQLVEQMWRTPNMPKLVQREVLDRGEYFERLADQWLRPIYQQGRRAMAAASAGLTWPDEELPLVVIAMYHLLWGYFTAAAILERVIGVEPFAPEMQRLHVKFLKEASHRLMRGG